MFLRCFANFGAVNAALAVAFAVAAWSARADDVPAGWSRAADGTYTHVESGVVCPVDVKGYSLRQVEGPSDPGFLGICSYQNADGVAGLIRIRRYIEGVGETPLAIQNDYGLMHPDVQTGNGIGKMVDAFRGGPGPVVDGVQTRQMVTTTVVRGLLVDCIDRQAKEGMPPHDFSDACWSLNSPRK